MEGRRIRFGTFLAPFHSVRENPTLAFDRDLALVDHLDRLGFDEVWVGEHHSGGMEIIASPEIFIAAAAERTRRIMLGTGVVTLPYHHPFLVAERINQLDHQTGGRTMFGVGAGALPYDADMLGIDVARIRDMMTEALDVIVPLLDGETVSRRTDWFELREARLQLAPFTRPRVELAVPSVASPSGATIRRPVCASRPKSAAPMAIWSTATSRGCWAGSAVVRRRLKMPVTLSLPSLVTLAVSARTARRRSMAAAWLARRGSRRPQGSASYQPEPKRNPSWRTAQVCLRWSWPDSGLRMT